MAEYVWMKATEDEYELPVAVANSARELARILGIKTNSIYSRISHVRCGRNKSTTYKKVRIDDEEEQNHCIDIDADHPVYPDPGRH